jgi:hypothetical protein
VERSNENTRVLLDVMARFAPEQAGFFGIDGLDEEVTRLPLDAEEQAMRAIEGALATLRPRLDQEKDPAVREDLEILIAAAETASTISRT